MNALSLFTWMILFLVCVLSWIVCPTHSTIFVLRLRIYSGSSMLQILKSKRTRLVLKKFQHIRLISERKSIGFLEIQLIVDETGPLPSFYRVRHTFVIFRIVNLFEEQRKWKAETVSLLMLALVMQVKRWIYYMPDI